MSESVASSGLPVWVPSAEEGGRLVACGRWWDAVSVDTFDGVRAIAHLGGECGPFVEDGAGATMTWLVAPDCAAGWELRGVRVRGRGHWLMVPPVSGDGALCWRRVPGPGARGWLTRPTVLRAALGAVLGVRPERRRAR